MKVNDELILDIEKFADKGKALARVDGRVVFVSGVAPQDKIRARIFKKKRQHLEAKCLEVLTESPLRTQPICQHFGACGGCKWQHIRYEAQLEAKRQSVEDALIRLGGFSDAKALPTLSTGKAFGYRNKMEFSFSAKRWLTDEEIASGASFDTSFAVGMHAPGRFDAVIDLKACYLPHPIAPKILDALRNLALSKGWKPWDTRNQTGFLRHLVIRTAFHTQDIMVNLVTHQPISDEIQEISHFLQSNFPEITTFVHTLHTGLGQTVLGEAPTILFGEGIIRDEIGGLNFEIAPNAFFQTNTEGAELLYAVAKRFANLQPDDVLYDLYCGAGTISLFVAPQVKKVVGIELVPEAIENAKANALRNQIDNCTFVAGDMLKLFNPDFIATNGKPNVLIVDPPRAGMHPKVVQQIAQLAPERLVYVSCNPQTQARDLADLKALYDLEALQPVDMFPQTYHVESVALLRLKK